MKEIDVSALSTAVLVEVNIGLIPTTKIDKGITREVAQSHGLSGTPGRYLKTLFDETTAPSLIGLTKLAREVRSYLYEVTLPFSNRGPRILTGAMAAAYYETMGDYVARFETLRREVIANYDGYVAAQPARLQTMYDADDYMHRAEVAERLYITVPSPLPVPCADHLPDHLPAEVLAQAQRDTEARIAAAQADVVERLVEAIGKVARTLGTDGGRIHPGLIQGLHALTGLVPSLNLTGDPALDKFAAEVRDQLTALTEDQLRHAAPEVRAEVAQKAQKLASRAAQFGGMI